MFRDNTLKRRLASGEPSLGAWLQLAEPSIAEIASLVGYDFLILDNEHGPGAIETTIQSLRAAQAGTATCMVRAPGNDGDYLKRILDAGAEAVMVPMVHTVADAKAVVEACRYPPQGRRGYSAPTVRASGYGAAADYARRANDELLICVQIESAQAIRNAEKIAAVPGVDLVFIGVADLSGDLGLLEQSGDPKVAAQIAKAEKAVRRTGKPLGTIPRPGRSLVDLVADGYTFVAGLADAYLLRAGMASDVEAFRTGVSERAPAAPATAKPAPKKRAASRAAAKKAKRK